MTALVFNCAFNGLSIIQELGRRGIDVYALDSFRNVGTTSRYATYRSCPNPTTDEAGFVEYLLDIADEFDDKPVLIPTNDHWAAAVAHHREELAEHYHTGVADAETVDLLIDKDAFGEWATERDYPVPRSWMGDELDDVPESAFPVAAKPNDATGVPDMMFDSTVALLYNRLFGDGSGPEFSAEEQAVVEALSENRLEVFETRDELERFRQEYEDVIEHFVVQEYVRGMSDQMYTVGVYANEGEVKGLFTGRKVRGYPPDIGDCKVGQAQSVPDHLVAMVKSMSEDLGYHGIGEFEFKRDVETGEYFLIEVNPRSWSWIGITPATGVSLPWMAYADQKNTYTFDYQESSVPDGSVTWVKAFEDLPNSLYFYRRSHPEWTKSLGEWWASIDSDTLVVAELAKDDPLPTAYATVLVGRRLVNETLDGVLERLA
ncbi:putative ATP-grasp enzyme [Halanaeroarchaeum sp. HSR-CO]|uniref:carboxylate--amine ligase n=1 Tax=Halanaeroarchaeum sp. HSR-CO TaxID=2866382 RepID=UPI00217E4A51|nr:hypothetical protein [Halanaeroarchaeum sp. HSR-CO]UWG48162.1 putative ATP-grasp enzyme [Halanaeroarchaeum sp. HSR-CO]